MVSFLKAEIINAIKEDWYGKR